MSTTNQSKLFTASFLYGFMLIYALIAMITIYIVNNEIDLLGTLHTSSESIANYTYYLFILGHITIPMLGLIYIRDKVKREPSNSTK